MKWKSLLTAWLGTLLFLSGVLLGLALSGAAVWAESEALIYSSYNGDKSLALRCPLMISPAQAGVANAEIMNLTTEEIKPVVTAEISHGKVPREVSQTVSLRPGKSTTVEWVVNSSDVIFERLILLNALQSRYNDNPSRSGSCGILLFSLFGLSGMQTFALVFAVSILLMLTGGRLWIHTRRPLDRFSESIVQIHSLLLVATILSLVSTLAHRWGLALILDSVILMIYGVVLTDFVLFRARHETHP